MLTTDCASQATNVEFDIREDEEQAIKMQDTIDLLLAAGYFRARIKAIPPFDRIVGGMVWCITLCNTTVDVDLIYSESSSIKQKLALTEKVVEVLPQLKCPHSIEPHQIQGLDFINIYPVVQWLVKQALEAKEKQGDAVKSYALHYFDTKCASHKSLDEANKKTRFEEDYRTVKSLLSPQRIYRRPKGFSCSSLYEDVQCTLMEYGWRNPVSITAESSSRIEQLEASTEAFEEQITERLKDELSKGDQPPQTQRVDTRMLAKLIDTSGLQKAADDVEKMLRTPLSEEDNFADHLARVQSELRLLEEEEGILESMITNVEGMNSTLSKEINDHEQRLSSLLGKIEKFDENEISKYKKLIEAYDEIKNREARFKADCKRELQKMDNELIKLRSELNSSEATNKEQEKKEHETALNNLNEIRSKDAAINREIAMVQRQIDSVPSQIEISQYQRRIIELYSQMALRNREIKQLYNLHNTLIDVASFKNKEIDLLNNIEDIQEMAVKESYKQSFSENLQKFLKGVENMYDKVLARKKQLETLRDQLRLDYQCLLEKERMYHKTVEDFKKECQTNEDLLEKLESLGISVEK